MRLSYEPFAGAWSRLSARQLESRPGMSCFRASIRGFLSNVADLLGFSQETRSRRIQRLAVIVRVNVAGRRLA